MENLNHPKPRISISESDLGLTGIPAKNTKFKNLQNKNQTNSLNQF